MIKEEKPDIVGHLDKVKMNNKGRYFSEDEPWYENLIEDVIRTIKSCRTIVEVNTRGIYKHRGDELFPGKRILKLLSKYNIPITLSSDAHKPEEISGAFEETLLTLKDEGFKNLLIFAKKSWKEIKV